MPRQVEKREAVDGTIHSTEYEAIKHEAGGRIASLSQSLRLRLSAGNNMDRRQFLTMGSLLATSLRVEPTESPADDGTLIVRGGLRGPSRTIVPSIYSWSFTDEVPPWANLPTEFKKDM